MFSGEVGEHVTKEKRKTIIHVKDRKRNDGLGTQQTVYMS